MTVLTIPAVIPRLPEITLPPSLLPVGTQPNAPLAYATLDHIDLNPEQWDQGRWFCESECGTRGCFAGWACFLVGDTMEYDNDHGVMAVRTFDTHDRISIDWRAKELLNISTYQARWLFHGGNDREDLGDLVLEAFGPRP